MGPQSGVATMTIYEAVFLHARACPLYNGETRIIVFERDEEGDLLRAVGTRVLPDSVTEPGDAAIDEALAELGYAMSTGSGAVAQDLAGWRTLVVPSA